MDSAALDCMQSGADDFIKLPSKRKAGQTLMSIFRRMHNVSRLAPPQSPSTSTLSTQDLESTVLLSDSDTQSLCSLPELNGRSLLTPREIEEHTTSSQRGTAGRFFTSPEPQPLSSQPLRRAASGPVLEKVEGGLTPLRLSSNTHSHKRRVSNPHLPAYHSFATSRGIRASPILPMSTLHSVSLNITQPGHKLASLFVQLFGNDGMEVGDELSEVESSFVINRRLFVPLSQLHEVKATKSAKPVILVPTRRCSLPPLSTPSKSPASSIVGTQEDSSEVGAVEVGPNTSGLLPSRLIGFVEGEGFVSYAPPQIVRMRSSGSCVFSGLPRNIVSPSFDSLLYSSEELAGFLVLMLSQLRFVVERGVRKESIVRLVSRVWSLYSEENAYHNAHHAFDVVQMVLCLIGFGSMSGVLSEIEEFCVVMAATCHDLEHPGVNNMFQVNGETMAAQLANDRSVLESFSASRGWSLLTAEGSDVIGEAGLTVGERKEIRQKFGQCILATDMAEHFKFLQHGNEVEKDLRRMMEHRGSGGSGEGGKKKEKNEEQWNESVMFLMKLIVKAADISNLARPFAIALKWSERMTHEMLDQRVKEEENNLSISIEKKGFAASEVGFTSFVVKPLFSFLSRLIPEAQCLACEVEKNLGVWMDVSSGTMSWASAVAQNGETYLFEVEGKAVGMDEDDMGEMDSKDENDSLPDGKSEGKSESSKMVLELAHSMSFFSSGLVSEVL
ncbi:putative 3',5'-cyclic-nucleotide phosphodiesterase regA [Blattamonas nauphoetae]|uniref:Phosphodiesterase n=1 Tax=Blattamonas nauphoetae TaxID=2049346 RepID=A0ABQ9XFX7_9EUKA|nr:putative 3',5'-cyclic-nucleotide phosphodiesterase regA [Blattamonas nauphoetae]